MKLKSFKESDKKKIGILLFTIVCILLVTGSILYKTFAIFEVKTNQNIINGQVKSMEDLEFVFYKDDIPTKNVPTENGYAFDSSKSYCIDRETKSQVSNVSWNSKAQTIELNDVSKLGKVKCYIYFNKIYQETELNGAIPDLGNGRLVPITLNETGQAVKANIMDVANPWYKYTEQRWANAVILRTQENYEVGQIIPEDNIESYFVWIPRYQYQLWNGLTETNEFTGVTDLNTIENATNQAELNIAQKINIRFVTKEYDIQYGINKGDWLTHPAFTSFNSNGMWVGKFETGYKEASDRASAEKNTQESDKIIIKPNVYSWRAIQVSNAFYISYHYKRDLESHMMKNTEWGAVTYLTNSQYGRCSSTSCTEVRINNNGNFVTGSSAVDAPTCGYTGVSSECNKYGTDSDTVIYSDSASVASSTTNNYYGVFDMAGGASEYVMGVMLDKNGKPASGLDNIYNSNFVGTLTCPECKPNSNKEKKEWTVSDGGKPWPDSKYYDTYEYANNEQQFQRGLLGDGTKEFGPFYQVTYKTGSGNSSSSRQVSGWNADRAYFVGYGAV